MSERDDNGDPQGGQLAYLDQALWKRFHEAQTTAEFATAWLALQCSMLSNVYSGVVVLGADNQGYAPVASWPDAGAVAPLLMQTAESALAAGKGVVNKPDNAVGSTSPLLINSDSTACAAYPLLLDGQILGVAAVEVEASSDTTLRSLMRQLQWGCGWLELELRKQLLDDSAGAGDAGLAVELAALVLEAEHFQEAATAVVTELATRLDCDRVSLGIREGKHSKVVALSHSAQFGKYSNLTRAVATAMDEALDQHTALIYPQADEQAVLVDRAHADLAETGGGQHICTVPLLPNGDRFGAITLDRRGNEFTPEQLTSIRRVAAFIGPVLASKYAECRWIGWKVGHSLTVQLGRLLGPRYIGRKLVMLALTGLLTFLFVATDTWRISANATLEGAVERVVVAPIAGYIIEARVRAGGVVKEGDLLFRIDDRDLRLEYLKWASQKEQIQRKLRDALAQHERSEVNVFRAQLEQSEAQLTLVGEQVARTRVTAPFDGVVVSGDLSDQLGAPVERGQVLFNIAPLDQYRVALQVEEAEISAIQPGQSGQLVLASMPYELLPIKVETITPVSNPAGGQNTFLVEASLTEMADFLRPGMQGNARIGIEERRLIWIWTHDLVSWLRLWFWSWWP